MNILFKSTKSYVIFNQKERHTIRLKFGIVTEDGICLLPPKLKRSKSFEAAVDLLVIGVSKRFKFVWTVTGFDWTGAPNKSSVSRLLFCLTGTFDWNKSKLWLFEGPPISKSSRFVTAGAGTGAGIWGEVFLAGDTLLVLSSLVARCDTKSSKSSLSSPRRSGCLVSCLGFVSCFVFSMLLFGGDVVFGFQIN